MWLRQLRDVFAGQDIYIVGTGPTLNVFPLEMLQDKICLSLNDAYKAHPAIAPMALMHHQLYAHTDKDTNSDYHGNLKNIKYPIVKATDASGRKSSIGTIHFSTISTGRTTSTASGPRPRMPIS